MPRWEAKPEVVKSEPLIPSLLVIISVFFLLTSVYLVLNSPGMGNILLFMFSLSLLIFFSGRLFGELTKHRDYIEITSDGLRYRSTPPFGNGWLPQSGFLPFEQIIKADLVQVSPSYNTSRQVLAILVQSSLSGNQIIGSNLSQQQLLKVGIALKGTVSLSNQLQRFLGVENVGESFKGFMDTAKTIWNQFKETQRDGDR